MSDERRDRTDVATEVMFLGKLVERIAAGKIRVPRFQRTFVWRQAELLALLVSILRGFPIGAILVWDTEDNIESTERIGPVDIGPSPGGMIGYLLDGQQRVSTLVGTLRLTDDMEHVVHEVDWCVYCDLDTGEFQRAPREGPGPQHFPVRSLLNTVGFFDACRRIQSEVDDPVRSRRWLEEADRLANAFRDYQLPLIHIREADIDSAVAVFARLNRSGRKMAADEMVSALTYQKGQFHLAQKLDEFQAELNKRRFGNLDRRFSSQSGIGSPGSRHICQGLGETHGRAGGPREASRRIRVCGGWYSVCAGVPEPSWRDVRPVATLRTPTGDARGVLSAMSTTRIACCRIS